jgi:hypothetical protein
MTHRVKVTTHKQLFYAAEDNFVFRVWADIKNKPDEFEVLSAAELLTRIRCYRLAGIPCFNAARMYNPPSKIKRGECRHAI